MICLLAQNHRMRDAPLRVQPLIGLLPKRCDAPLFEKLRCESLGRRFVGNVLSAFFAEFEMRALAVRLRPGATRTIDAVRLIQLQKRAGPADWAHLFESVFNGA